jgi:predicted O-methyltransferase YrrM
MNGMDSKVEAVKKEYQERADREVAIGAQLQARNSRENIDDLLLPIGPATGSLLSILIQETKSRAILEVGTSYGYSTVWLAQAARDIDGHVMSLEWHQPKVDYARQMLERAGLANYVSFIVGDARASLTHVEHRFDLVLLDLWKDLYVPVFDMLIPHLNPGAVIVADNMLFPIATRPHAELYRVHVRTRHDMDSVLLQVGSGIEVTRYNPAS